MGGRASSARAGAAASRANTAAARDRRRMGPAFNRETGPRRAGLYNSYSRNRRLRRPGNLAATDRTRITKPSPIVEDDQGQLRARKGVSREVIEELSKIKGEPDWMRAKRLKSYEIFERKPVPTWGVDLSELNFDDLVLYSPPTAGRYNSWDDVPAEMKQTYDDPGTPQANPHHPPAPAA